MAKFPIQEARQELGITPSTAVRANIDVRTSEGAVGAAIGQGLIAGARELQRDSARKEAIKVQNRKNLDTLSAKQADNRRTKMKNDIAAMKLETPPENWEEETTKIVTQGNNEISTFDYSPEEATKQQIVSQGDLQSLPDESFIAASKVISKATITTAEETLTGLYRDGDKKKIAAGVLSATETFRGNGVSAQDILLKLSAAKAAGEKLHRKDSIEGIKPSLISAIDETGDKESAIAVLNASTNQLVKDGILTEEEAAEANKVLGDWVDNFVAGRFKQGKDAIKLTTKQSYEELLGPIVDATLTFEDIEQSKLLKADKEKWQDYIRGSYKESPTQNTPDGHTLTWNAVYDAATLAISPTEAYDAILEARFQKRMITNDQFNWAVNKIQNPYPKEIIEDIRTTVKSNLEDFNRYFSRDNERNKVVNESLLAWVDEVIKQDKVPLFDFKKKMYAMSSQFRVGDDRWYDIGQIITRGNREWEVVGFDADGEPLVEEVE